MSAHSDSVSAVPTAATPTDARPAGRAAAMAPDDRRAMIVRATLPLLIEHGEAVTTKQIAAAAGIAEGTIFRAFPDKDALIAAVVDAAYDPAPLDRALAEIDRDQPFEAALLAAVKVIQRRVVDVWRVASSVGPRHQPGKRRHDLVSEPLVELLTVHRSKLGVEPRDAARWLRAVTLAVSHPGLAEKPMAPTEVVSLFLHGVAVRRGRR